MLGPFFVSVERLDVFIRAVEVESADWFAIVVVEQNAKIRLSISFCNAVDVVYFGV